MKISLLLIMLSVLNAYATNIFSQNGTVSIDMQNVTVREVVSEIERQGGINFLFNDNLAGLNQRVNVLFTDQPIKNVLTVALGQADMMYEEIKDNFVVLLPKPDYIKQQERTVTGRVTDADTGEPLPGVSVVMQGTTTGTVTNADGEYTLSNVPGDATLVFSFVGMLTQEVPVENRTSINVMLESEVIGLDEVVVTALGISRERKTLGYSVQDISSEELIGTRDNNFVNSLSGKIAGVQITKASSALGSSSRITIRGNATFSGNRPLFVVDGTPVVDRTQNLGASGGIDWGDIIADIDPSIIESITVLKGANAAALYGERATNGVVLISTKRGPEEKGTFTVDVNSSVTYNQPSYYPNFQNEYGGGYWGSEYHYNQFLENNPGSDLSYNEYARQYSYNYVDGMGGGVNDSSPLSWGPRLDAGLNLDQWSTGPNSPWVSRPDNYKEWFRTGENITNSITIGSSGDFARGRVTFTNQNSTGIRYYTDQRQNSVSTSLDLTLTDRMTANVNATYLNRASDNLARIGYGGFWLGFKWMQRDVDMARVKELQDENDYIYPRGDNPYWSLKNNPNSFDRDRLYGNVNINYELTEWLSATAKIGTDLYNEYRKSTNTAQSKGQQRAGRGGNFNQNQRYNQELNADILLFFDQRFDQFRVDGQIGANYREDRYKFMSMGASDLTVPDVFNIANVKGTPSTGMYESQKITNSAFFAANASYNDYLFFGVTGRNDWSSTLPSDNRSYFYPSVSLGFSLTDALPIESNILNYARLRGSWARVGKDTAPYQLHRTYSARTFGGTTLLRPTNTLPPISLRPETTTSYEFGGYLSLFDTRIDIDLTYYKQITKDQILAVPTSLATGYGSRRYNAGEIENRGVEIVLNGHIMRNPQGLNWKATVNWARNINMVNALYGDLESYQIGAGQGGTSLVGIAGEAWGVLWGPGYVRNEDGQIIVNDRGIPLTSGQPMITGYATPDWIGGINNSFRYKNVDLRFLINIRMGGDMFSVQAKQAWPTGAYQNTVRNNVRETGLIVDGVKQDGTPNDVRISAEEFYRGGWMWSNNEFATLDGSFVKLSDLRIGYNFNTDNLPWLKSLNLFVAGGNLAILYQHESTKDIGMDPEVQLGGGDAGVGFENHQRPATRNYSMGLNVRF